MRREGFWGIEWVGTVVEVADLLGYLASNYQMKTSLHTGSLILLLLICVGCESGNVSVSHSSVTIPTNTTTATILPTSTNVPTPTLIAISTVFPTPVGGGEQIAFISVNGNEKGKVYIINSDGSNDTKFVTLSSTEPHTGNPIWSPDGKRLGFADVDEFSGYGAVHLVEKDGSSLRQLASTYAFNFSWSPDGKKIAVLQNKDFRPSFVQIFVIDIEGDNRYQLTNENLGAFNPVWSPDGDRIAFKAREVERVGDDFEIYVINLDGSNLHQLTDNNVDDDMPNWTVNGEQIIFVSDRDGDSEIYSINVDGGNLRQLTKNDVRDTSPRLSPNGKEIVFISDRDGDAEIYLMNIDGSNVRQLTNNEVSDDTPIWSPDGKKVAFSSLGDNEKFGIYTINADGSNIQRLTNYEASDFFWLAWQPTIK